MNGPTYVTLVKDFWVRAEVYDVDAAKDEELKAVIRDSSLRGKTRQEMGLESFRQTEIRNANRNYPFLESYKGVVLKGNSSTKLVDIDGQHRMLLKFMMECEGEKNHKKGGLNCVFGNFFFYVLDNCPQV